VLLKTLTPSAREHLRNVLIRDQVDRDDISSRLMRYLDQNGQDWADIIDFLTMYPDERRLVVRLLGEIDAHR
jgi:DNA mismatch repair ATPase MutS